jgi:hypothetical protein
MSTKFPEMEQIRIRMDAESGSGSGMTSTTFPIPKILDEVHDNIIGMIQKIK